MSGHQEPIDRPVPDILPILPLRAAVVFPHAMSPLAAGRASSKRLIEDAAKQSRLIAVVMQRDPSEEEPGASGLHPIGTLAMIHRVLKQPDGTLRLIVQGVGRLRVVEVVETTPYLRARVEFLSDVPAAEQDVEAEALVRSATALFEKVVALSAALPDELANVVTTAEGFSALADVIAASLPTLALPVKQQLLETVDVKVRLQALVTALGKEAEVLELGSKIQSEIQSEMSKTQREYYLREQLKAIQKELGEGDERTQEIDGLREKIEQAGMTEEARKEALRELERLAKMPPAAAEYTVARTYLDWLLAMPWQHETSDAVDIARARTILDEDHEGLEKIKERILEHLAVKKIRPEGKDAVPPPLRDRMEVIHLAGYTEEEKVRIALQHLAPRQALEHGLADGTEVSFTPEAVRLLARGYTREAGVRHLEREIGSICRKVARRKAEGDPPAATITPDSVTSYLGVPRFEYEELEERTRMPGVVAGLAWTPAGGDLLFIEATRMKGTHNLTLTGQLGDVMKESAQAALSWVRSHPRELGIPGDFWDTSDIHIHVPAGAIPKDGPSAGITMTIALVSLLACRPVASGVAMTGEVSLSGRVLPVGGITEEVLAAHRAGVRAGIRPERNDKNVPEGVPRAVREAMTFHLVESVTEAIHHALGVPGYAQKVGAAV